jgi:hypothetical protein
VRFCLYLSLVGEVLVSRWVYSACLAGFLLLGAGSDALVAQSLQMTPATGGADRPTARAARVAEGPTVDGDVLGDPIWQQAAPIEGFKQYQPNEGQPVSERTEVRMAFTRDTLYIGVVCYEATSTASSSPTTPRQLAGQYRHFR